MNESLKQSKPVEELSPREPAMRGLCWLLVLGLIGWSIYHAVGVFRTTEDVGKAITKSLIVLGCMAGFLAMWGLALRSRKKNQQ